MSKFRKKQSDQTSEAESIQDLLLSDDAVRAAMSAWVAGDFMYRQEHEGQPTDKEAMDIARKALKAALEVAGDV